MNHTPLKQFRRRLLGINRDLKGFVFARGHGGKPCERRLRVLLIGFEHRRGVRNIRNVRNIADLAARASAYRQWPWRRYGLGDLGERA